MANKYHYPPEQRKSIEANIVRGTEYNLSKPSTTPAVRIRDAKNFLKKVDSSLSEYSKIRNRK